MDIDVVEIQHNLGCIIAELGLIRNDTASVSADRLRRLSDYLIDNQLAFEKAIRNEVRDKGSDLRRSELMPLTMRKMASATMMKSTMVCKNAP